MPTGKKSMDHVRDRVLAKARTIRPANVIMYWYHCIKELYNYLELKVMHVVSTTKRIGPGGWIFARADRAHKDAAHLFTGSGGRWWTQGGRRSSSVKAMAVYSPRSLLDGGLLDDDGK